VSGSKAIYLDYAATTPCDERVIAAMLPYFAEQFGNPMAVYRQGQRAFAVLANARRTLANGLNCAASELIFTSGGSEADNLAVRGVLTASRALGKQHLITSNIEHKAILATAQQLQAEFGCTLTVLPASADGQISPSQLAEAIRPDTALVSLAWGNNEIGSVNPIRELAQVCQARGVWFHSDAVQAASHLPIDLQDLGVDLLSLAAHKFYGPKGVGLLYVREGVPLLPTQTGGAQENNLRAGTHNLPLIVGMAKAFQILQEERAHWETHCRTLRDACIAGLLGRLGTEQAVLTGHPSERLPNHASFALHGVDANELLMHLDLQGIAASSGSACNTGNPEPSAVLLALGYAREWAMGALRLTVGRQTTLAEVHTAVQTIAQIVGA
jgi:cysteine desulfurase